MESLKTFGQIIAVVVILGILAGIAAGAFVAAGAFIGIFLIGVVLYALIQELFSPKD